MLMPFPHPARKILPDSPSLTYPSAILARKYSSACKFLDLYSAAALLLSRVDGKQIPQAVRVAVGWPAGRRNDI